MEEPSFEDIKSIVDEKRRKRTKPKPKPKPKPIIIKNEVKEEEEVKVEEIKIEEVPPTIQKQTSYIDKTDVYKDIYESINNLKDLINQQTNIIQEVIKPKPKKQRPKPKPKNIPKTLDLTIEDKEIMNIINEKKDDIKPDKNVDEKLQQFLKALQKR